MLHKKIYVNQIQHHLQYAITPSLQKIIEVVSTGPNFSSTVERRDKVGSSGSSASGANDYITPLEAGLSD
jgi:hypothetical protein